MKSKLAQGLAALLLLWVVALSGCRTSGTDGFASVQIKGHKTDEILQTTAAVFRADGYTLRSADGGQLVFERNGSTLNRVAYGNWGNDVVLRVRVRLEPVTADTYRLQCQAWMVRYAGDRILEDEQRLANFRSGPFQKLLDETAQQLK